jgi:hypothetical protein
LKRYLPQESTRRIFGSIIVEGSCHAHRDLETLFTVTKITSSVLQQPQASITAICLADSSDKRWRRPQVLNKEKKFFRSGKTVATAFPSSFRYVFVYHFLFDIMRLKTSRRASLFDHVNLSSCVIFCQSSGAEARGAAAHRFNDLLPPTSSNDAPLFE